MRWNWRRAGLQAVLLLATLLFLHWWLDCGGMDAHLSYVARSHGGYRISCTKALFDSAKAMGGSIGFTDEGGYESMRLTPAEFYALQPQTVLFGVIPF